MSLYDVLIVGTKRTFSFGNPSIDIGLIYGIIKREEQFVNVSNRIYEITICDYFISKDEESKNKRISGILQRDVVKDGKFDMELCLRKFAEHYAELFNEDDAGFLERNGRLLFLSYLKPLINGQGFYHIESQFTDLRRMDIVVDFGCEQFIVELKVWRGEKAELEAYEQLIGYMDTKNADRGYLLVFDFRLEKNKERKVEWVGVGGKRILEVMVNAATPGNRIGGRSIRKSQKANVKSVLPKELRFPTAFLNRCLRKICKHGDCRIPKIDKSILPYPALL